MKFFATLLIAAVVASAVMAEEPETRGIRDTILAKAKEIKAKIDAAIEVGKGKAKEVAKELGWSREAALAKLNELKARLDAKLKEVVIPAVGQAKQEAALLLKEQLAKAIKDLLVAKAKLENVQ
ncbi:hypothetical protein GE061_011399 [Apolygus lucorum]|uniref:Uncharacterized protein n=1 Tax=Apolygus lucorum TaxID=248454 RepID=A0A6A4JVT1_APOLU|nr:hypothetical protein GE061_011399 [Apolygus lucorum]